MQINNYILDSEGRFLFGLFQSEYSFGSLVRHAVCVFAAVEKSLFEIDGLKQSLRFISAWDTDKNFCFHPGDTL